MTMVLSEKENDKSLDVAADTVVADGKESVESSKNKLKEHLKEVPVTDVSPENKHRFEAVIQSLSNLVDDINKKKNVILDKRNIIQEKLELLRTFKSIRIDENEFKRSFTSSDEYIKLLDKMIGEMERDRTFYVSLISDNPPKSILVFKFEPDDFEYHIQQRILAIKKYVKTASRDLSVSFSRYMFGLDSQLNQLNYAEQVAKNREKKVAKD